MVKGVAASIIPDSEEKTMMPLRFPARRRGARDRLVVRTRRVLQTIHRIAKIYLVAVVASAFIIPTASAQTFRDVQADYWAAPFINALAHSGVTGGCGQENYCPEVQVTRAQMAVFLERGMRGNSYVPPAATGSVFEDVGVGDFAANFIEQLYADGITGGCGGGNYCPNATVTRDQMAVFLLRAKYGSGFTPPPPSGVFDDVPTSHWAARFVEQLASEGITGGCGGGNYCPDAAVTRAQMAVFLVRTFGIPPAPPDSEPPTVPTDVVVTVISNAEISLSWSPSTDDRYVAGYTVFRNGGFHSEVFDGSEFVDQGLSASTQYCYQVFAFDASGNMSAASTEQCGTTLAAPPVSFTFTRLVDTSTTVPGTSIPFQRLLDAKFAGSGIVFHAAEDTLNASLGIFRLMGSELSLIADPQLLSDFTNLVVDANTAYFLGKPFIHQGMELGLQGIFKEGQLGAEVVLDDQTIVPGTSSPWPFYGPIDVKDDHVAFRITHFDGAAEINIASGGVYSLIADMPGLPTGETGDYSRLFESEVVTSQGKVGFNAHQMDGEVERQGVYEFSGGLVSLIAVHNTLWPDIAEVAPPTWFHSLSYDGPDLVFTAQRVEGQSSNEYIFKHVAATSEFELILSHSDTTSGDENSRGHFNFGRVISRENRIAFHSAESVDAPRSYSGIKLKQDGALYRVLSGDDMLDGEQVRLVRLRDFNGQDMLVHVEFDGGAEALYRIAISE